MNELYNSLHQNQSDIQSRMRQRFNPQQINDMVNEVKQSGMTPKDYFFKKLKEQGGDLNSILGQLR
jgi:hypothetical protein